MSHVIETEPTCLLFDYDDPRPSMVSIRDIARSLSQRARFGGFSAFHWSVAQHAILVHRLLREAGFPADVCFAGLHHDSAEAYLGDVPTMLKRKLGPLWTDMERQVDEAIAAKLGFDLDLAHGDAVKAADEQALLIEAAILKRSQGVGPQWNNATRAYVPPASVRPQLCEQVELDFIGWHNIEALRTHEAAA